MARGRYRAGWPSRLVRSTGLLIGPLVLQFGWLLLACVVLAAAAGLVMHTAGGWRPALLVLHVSATVLSLVLLLWLWNVIYLVFRWADDDEAGGGPESGVPKTEE